MHVFSERFSTILSEGVCTIFLFCSPVCTVLEIAVALPSSFVRQGSLSLAEYTNTKTHKSLFHNLPHIGVLCSGMVIKGFGVKIDKG